MVLMNTNTRVKFIYPNLILTNMNDESAVGVMRGVSARCLLGASWTIPLSG